MTSCTVLPGLLFDLHESVQGKKSVFIVFAACLCVCVCVIAHVYFLLGQIALASIYSA